MDDNSRERASAKVPQGTGAKSLNDLPDEILLLIFSYVDSYRLDRIMGHTEDDPPPTAPDHHLIKDFLVSSNGLVSLALTCKRFLPLAQEQLMHAPIIGETDSENPAKLPQTRMVSFLRTLQADSSRSRYVKQLRLCLPLYDMYAHRDDEAAKAFSPAWNGYLAPILVRAHDVIKSLDFPDWTRRSLESSTFDNIEPTFVSLVLALLPQVERLCISQSNQSTRDEPEPLELYDYMFPKPGINFEAVNGLPQKGFLGITKDHSLTYLKLVSLLPAHLEGLSVFPNLRTLDISTKLASLSQRAISRNSELYASTTTMSAFKKIRHLRLDFQVKTVGIWDLGARACLTNILQAVKDLESLDFYAEPSDSKNPFRSVRAFPHYQANIQNYLDVSSQLDPNVEDQPYWDERIYDARTDITDYQNLVDAIVHLRPSLETLRLPGGFWALPGGMRKPLPRFDSFVQMKTLIVPQAAIISIKLDNMRFADVSGDFDLSPITVLPSSLLNLKIFDADISLLTSSWLRELFVTQKNCNQWPELQRLEILFGPYGYYGEVEMLLSRQSQQVFWTWVDEATFEVFVGKDDEVPSVSL